MLQISFSLCNIQPVEPKGFELGHITIVGELGQATSASRTPDQSMMLILSIVELLDGIRRSLFVLKRREYCFVGVDSSFSVIFRQRQLGINIYSDDMLIHTSTASSLKVDVERSVLEFTSNNDVSQFSTHAEVNDLDNAIRAFRAI